MPLRGAYRGFSITHKFRCQSRSVSELLSGRKTLSLAKLLTSDVIVDHLAKNKDFSSFTANFCIELMKTNHTEIAVKIEKKKNSLPDNSKIECETTSEFFVLEEAYIGSTE